MADKIVVMHDGRVEQIGAPLDLYDHPANLFVAGFIGSPAMNMLPGKIDSADGGRFVADGGISLPVPPPRSADGSPGGAAQGGAIYGLRPESLRLGGDIPFRIDVIEPTGSETHVTGALGSTPIVGVFRERIAAKPGDEIRVGIDTHATHLFDAGSGERISA